MFFIDRSVIDNLSVAFVAAYHSVRNEAGHAPNAGRAIRPVEVEMAEKFILGIMQGFVEGPVVVEEKEEPTVALHEASGNFTITDEMMQRIMVTNPFMAMMVGQKPGIIIGRTMSDGGVGFGETPANCDCGASVVCRCGDPATGVSGHRVASPWALPVNI